MIQWHIVLDQECRFLFSHAHIMETTVSIALYYGGSLRRLWNTGLQSALFQKASEELWILFQSIFLVLKVEFIVNGYMLMNILFLFTQNVYVRAFHCMGRNKFEFIKNRYICTYCTQKFKTFEFASKGYTNVCYWECFWIATWFVCSNMQA